MFFSLSDQIRIWVSCSTSFFTWNCDESESDGDIELGCSKTTGNGGVEAVGIGSLNGCDSTTVQVGQSTLEYACREHGIHIWPPHANITPMLVDQEEIQLWNSDTLPSNQALVAAVDTNSVLVNEILSPLVLPTAGQEHLDEDLGNDEVEAVGIRGEVTKEDEIAEVRLHCFGKRNRREKSPRGERGNKKATRVRNVIPLEEILQTKEMHLKDAARHLNVSRYTLKRICRNYNIHRWPPREEPKLIGQCHPNESPVVVDQERIPQLNSDMLLPSNQNSATSDTSKVTVKAKYNGLRMKFQLSSPWRKVELEQEVKKRLQLDAATYYISYKDDDDEMTLICCNEDLEGYILSTSHLGTRSIEILLDPK